MKNSRFLSILDGITSDDPRGHFKRNSKVLIIDGMNTFIRSFAVDNRMNYKGHHIGGISGFLKSIGAAIKLENPSRVIIAFDGEGGATNRRYLYPDYKKNREGNTRVMNWKSFDTKEEEDDAKVSEIDRLVNYLQLLPITLVAVDKIEADDVMSHIALKLYNDDADTKICIYTTDRDFYQLVNDRIYVYSPTKKKYYFEKDIYEETKIHPVNHLTYKCLTGDVSDNVKGVYGIGDKKILSLFPGMATTSSISVDDIYEICENPPKKSVLYERVLNCKRQVYINHFIMNLSKPNMSDQQIQQVDVAIDQPVTNLRKFDFINLYNKDMMGGAILGLDSWLNLFSRLNNY